MYFLTDHPSLCDVLEALERSAANVVPESLQVLEGKHRKDPSVFTVAAASQSVAVRFH